MKNKNIILRSDGPTFIDLFCGCGGFSLGAQSAGLNCLAGIDFNSQAVETFKLNHSEQVISLNKDLTQFQPEELSSMLGVNHLDVIVGGPPCQGFSTARQFSGSNSGERIVDDPRRDLYKYFLKFVNYFKPKIFIMENVLGIKNAQNGIYFTAIQNEARKIGYRVAPFEINSWEYGVPQRRIRQLFIGTLNEMPIFIPEHYIVKTHSKDTEGGKFQPLVFLGEAIEDLPQLKAGDERITQNYNLKLREKYFKKYSGRYLLDVLQIENSPSLTWHCARPHNDRDLRDFARLKEGENCHQALARGVEMEFPYNRESFKDRYTKQSRTELSTTILAHLKSDGLKFIHPTQNRSFTPREAARVQSFPDTFLFSGTRSHIFTQIGNAVPPLVGKAVGLGIVEYLSQCNSNNKTHKLKTTDKNFYVSEIEKFVNKYQINILADADTLEFNSVWKKILLIFPHLHPESVLDNGKELSPMPKRQVSFCIEPTYIRSGWPVELAPIALEAYRRYKLGILTFNEYYGTLS